jgi:hypothetical protein
LFQGQERPSPSFDFGPLGSVLGSRTFRTKLCDWTAWLFLGLRKRPAASFLFGPLGLGYRSGTTRSKICHRTGVQLCFRIRNDQLHILSSDHLRFTLESRLSRAKVCPLETACALFQGHERPDTIFAIGRTARSKICLPKTAWALFQGHKRPTHCIVVRPFEICFKVRNDLLQPLSPRGRLGFL